MDESWRFSLESDSDDRFFFIEEDVGSPYALVEETPSHSEKTYPRICVHPFRTLQSSDPAVRLLNAYFTIYPHAGQ